MKEEGKVELNVTERSGKQQINEQKVCLEMCFIGNEFHRPHFILKSYSLLRYSKYSPQFMTYVHSF